MRTVAVVLDGVLRKPLDREALDQGARLLFHSLSEHYRIVVLGGEESAKERDRVWLASNQLVRYVHFDTIIPEDGDVVVQPDGSPMSTSRFNQIMRLRTEGWHFDFLVVPDPELAKDVYAAGMPVLLYLHPTYTSPSFRPDYEGGIRSWDDLVREVEFQVKVKAEREESSA